MPDKNWDPVSDEVPALSKWENCDSVLDPHTSAIPETPGEKATNDPTGLSYNKGQPFGKGGSGYTKSG